MVANMILLFVFIIHCFFVLYLYSRRAHKTREHVFSLLLSNVCCHYTKHTHTYQETKQTHKHRQQGHVAHNKNTLDSQPQSNLFLLFPLPPLLNPPPSPANIFSTCSTLSPDRLLNSYIYKFSYAQLCTLCFSPQLPLSSFHVSYCFSASLMSLLSPLLLSVCLTTVVGFCIALLFLFFFFPSKKFFFFFWGVDSIYLYK